MKVLKKSTVQIALVVLGLLQLGWGINVLRAQDCSGGTNCDSLTVTGSYCLIGCSGCCSILADNQSQCCCVWVGPCDDPFGFNGSIYECCSGCYGGLPLRN